MRGFFGFWWCIAFALLAVVCLSASITEGDVTWTWINSIVAVIWLFYAWNAKRRDALEAETGDDNNDWSPPNGSSER